MLLSFENKSINMPHEALKIKLHFWTFAHKLSSISNLALEIISELTTSFSLVGAIRLIFLIIVPSLHVISFVLDFELEKQKSKQERFFENIF